MQIRKFKIWIDYYNIMTQSKIDDILEIPDLSLFECQPLKNLLIPIVSKEIEKGRSLRAIATSYGTTKKIIETAAKHCSKIQAL